MIALQIIFWLSILTILHSYLFFPLIVRFLAKNREPNHIVHRPGTDADWPHLIVVMAVHNEEAVLEETLRSMVNSQYPAGHLEILVGSDNSTDRTNQILERFEENYPGMVKPHFFQGRNGKIRIVNQLVEKHRQRLTAEKGDYVLVQCDANVSWSSQLPHQLARHFKNPKIGLVGSNVLDSTSGRGGIAQEEDAYINRENQIKYHEGIIWGRMMGAFGACYAMRGRLFEPTPEHFRCDDFFQTIRCFELGYHAIVEPEAISYETVSEDIEEEFGRKTRISLGNFQNMARFRRFLFIPWHCGFGTFFAFWSHKGLRYFGPLFLAGAIITSAILAFQYGIYLLAFLGIAATLAAAVIDGILARYSRIHIKPLRFVRYFYLMNVALIIGAAQFVVGEKTPTWTPAKRVAASEPS
ncbi:MAG: glycosyltransferase [Verrucomicrobiales bacterium]|nr:glycosyltransferase [Verrucomicrobiales bacterium]